MRCDSCIWQRRCDPQCQCGTCMPCPLILSDPVALVSLSIFFERSLLLWRFPISSGSSVPHVGLSERFWATRAYCLSCRSILGNPCLLLTLPIYSGHPCQLFTLPNHSGQSLPIVLLAEQVRACGPILYPAAPVWGIRSYRLPYPTTLRMTSYLLL